MQQRMVDRWIEAAEARRVCERAMGEQRVAHPIAHITQPLLLMTKLRAMMMLRGACPRTQASAQSKPWHLTLALAPDA